MKYIEELAAGSLFRSSQGVFALGADFKDSKNNTKRMCINIDNGFVQWIDSTSIVEYLDLYYRDEDGNILPIKEFKNSDFTKN